MKNKKNNVKKILPIAAFVLMFFMGLAIILYPTVSNIINQKGQSQAIKNYEQSISEASSSEIDYEYQKAVEYNENLAGDPVHDPFVYGSGYALPKNYTSVLNINGDGIMGYIRIPEINVELPIYHGTSDETLAVGIGHIESTSLPIGGMGTHSVLTGHSGLSNATLFTNLPRLKVGDNFYITTLNKTFAYEVDSIKTVLPEDVSSLVAEPDKDCVTLITCTPYSVNTHRLLVHGVRVEYSGDPDEITELASSLKWYEKISITEISLIAGLSLVLIVIIIITVILLPHRKRKNRSGDGK